MKPPVHQIQQQILDFEFSSKERALEWQRTLTDRFQPDLIRSIEPLLDQMDPGNLVFIPKLEIDLGTIQEERVISEVRNAFADGLLKAMSSRTVRQTANNRPGHTRDISSGSMRETSGRPLPVSELSMREASVRAADYFLRMGTLPGISPVEDVKTLIAFFREESEFQALAGFLERQGTLGREMARQRLYFQFPKTFAWRILESVLKAELAAFRSLERGLRNITGSLPRAFAGGRRLPAWSREEWIDWLVFRAGDDPGSRTYEYLAYRLEPVIRKPEVRALLETELQEYHVQHQKMPPEHLIGYLKDRLPDLLSGSSPGNSGAGRQPSEPGTGAEGSNSDHPGGRLTDTSPRSPDTDKPQAPESHREPDAGLPHGPGGVTQPQQDGNRDGTREAKVGDIEGQPDTNNFQRIGNTGYSETPGGRGGQASFPAKSGAIGDFGSPPGDSDRPAQLNGKTGQPANNRASKDPVTGHEPGFWEEALPDAGWYTRYSGVILTWPYLERFFTRLGYMETHQFTSGAAHEMCVHLVAYMASGEAGLEEPDLVIPKLLCGWPLMKPIRSDCLLLAPDRDEAQALLSGFIGHWSILKNTSIAGLRETFFERDGKLTENDDHWTLIVEQKGTDVLLDYLPFGRSIIRLPWIRKMLQVEWA